MAALAKDAYARSALVTMACALAAAGAGLRSESLGGLLFTDSIRNHDVLMVELLDSSRLRRHVQSMLILNLRT